MTHYLGGADLSLFVGAVVTFAIYYPWASSRKRVTMRHNDVHHRGEGSPTPESDERRNRWLSPGSRHVRAMLRTPAVPLSSAAPKLTEGIAHA